MLVPQDEFTNTLELISNNNLNHKLLVESTLIENSINYDIKDNNIVANFDTPVTIFFDEMNRIINIEAKELK